MRVFNFLFRSKPKEVMNLTILGKDYVVTRSFKGELFLNGEKLEGKGLSESELIAKKKRHLEFEAKQKTNKVDVPFSQCFEILYDLETPYFGCSKKIELLKHYLLIITQLPIDEYYALGRDSSVNRIKKYYDLKDISKSMKYVYNYPAEFLNNIDNYHTQLLLRSIDSLDVYWDIELRSLQRKNAIVNRINYLIDGYKTIKEELKLLDYKDINKVDFYINKYKEKLEEYNV